MVDNDEFRRNVPKGFQGASRAVFNRVDRERAIRLAVNAAGEALKEGGCPGLEAVVEVVVASEDRTESGVADRCRALDVIDRECAHDRTSRAVRAAKAVVREPAGSGLGASVDPARAIAEGFVIDLIDAKVFTGQLSPALIKAGKETFASYLGRRSEFLDELRGSEHVTKLAAELLADPWGSRVRRQRATRREHDPRADLDLALTAD